MNPEPADDLPQPAGPPAEPAPGDGGIQEAPTHPAVLTGDLDYEVLNMIGRGGYGEVYLARAKDGSFFAVKVVYRVSFEDQRPYEREYEGIRYFEPVSKLSESQLQILRVGRRDEAGYFYYIMEAADDVAAGRQIHPATYYPRTLKSEMQQHGGRIPVRACCEIGLALAAALENLHSHRLVHRDIKPANIIFVHNNAKLADPGLVAAADQTLTCVGTEGYIPPEGPGSPRADIYALGMVLYEAFTGFRRQDFPKLPEDLEEWPEHALALKLNRIVTKACEARLRRRYQSAREIRRDLERLLERHPPPVATVTPVLPRRWLPAFGIAVMLLLALAGGIRFRHHRTAEKAAAASLTEADFQSQNAPAAGPPVTISALVAPAWLARDAGAYAGSSPEASLQTLFTGTLDNGLTNTPGQPPVRALGDWVAGPGNDLYARAGRGNVVRLRLDGKLTPFANFGPADGNIDNFLFNPKADYFFGTTTGDSANGQMGQIFQLNSLGEINQVTRIQGQPTPRPAGIIFDPNDQHFYGTLRDGGRDKLGAVVEMDFTGTTRVIASFDGTNGKQPAIFAPLLMGIDGCLYGTTRGGGEYGQGTVYCCTPGGEIRTLHSFAGPDGREPVTGLVPGDDGFLYGTTLSGSTNNFGNIFKISATGDFRVLAAFANGNGIFYKQLCPGRDGNLYGYTAGSGGAGGYGSIFRLTPAGQLSTLFTFNGRNGSLPRNLIQGADGNLYGTCHYGGAGFTDGDPKSGSGTVFRLILSPAQASLPANPPAPAEIPVRTAATAGSPPAAELQTLLTGTFESVGGGDRWPVRNLYRLVLGADGNFYGSTGWGGGIIRLAPDGRLTTLTAMAKEGFINDLIPMPGNRAFFVTTRGDTNRGNFGRLYYLTLSGNITLISDFSQDQTPRPDRMSYNPFDHNFYGVDWGEKDNYGAIVQMTPTGATRIFGSFDENNGHSPRGEIAFWGGEIYGSTEGGGEFNKGAVFSANTNGVIHLLHSFNDADGKWPLSGLIPGTNGLFYGTAATGGSHGQGTVFQVSQTGDFKLLASLSAIQRPRAETLCFGRDGNLYGVTDAGGNAGDYGTIFRLTPGEELQTLFSFDGTNGACPRDLIQGEDGNLYGICQYGGAGFTHGTPKSGSGTVFRLKLATGPAPKPMPAVSLASLPLSDNGQTGDWQLFSPGQTNPQDVPCDHGSIVLDQPNSLVTSRNSDYTNLNFTVELEAAAGTEAYVGVRLQQHDGQWVGLTSCVFDDGNEILAGRQWSNFQGGQVEHGMARMSSPYGKPLTIHLSLKNLLMWIKVNGTVTSGVDYHQRFHTDAGCVGIKLVKGSVRIRRLEVESIP